MTHGARGVPGSIRSIRGGPGGPRRQASTPSGHRGPRSPPVASFTFKVTDGSDESAVPTVLIDNNNTQPTATVPSDPIATVNEDGDGGVIWAGQDITGWRDDGEDDSVTYTFTQPANGTLTGDETGLTYTPDADFPYAVRPDAADSFTFQMSDRLLDSPVYTVNVNVTNVNDAPVAGAVSASADINTDITDIQLTGTDVDGDTLTYSIASAADLPEHGTIYDGADPDTDPQLNAGNLALAGSNYIVSYRPEAGWTGADSFRYKANDGALDSLSATVTIAVFSDFTDSGYALGGNNHTTSVALGKVDGDGDLDIVEGNPVDPIRLYLNNGTAAPFTGVAGSDITADAHSTRSVALGDVDGDGDLDIAAGNYGQANRVYRNNLVP